MEGVSVTPVSIADSVRELCAVRGHKLPEPLRVPAGKVLFQEGVSCQGFPVLLEGEVRVFKALPHGRELTLYHVHRDNVCIQSASGLFNDPAYSASGVSVGATSLILLPPSLFLDLLSDPVFQRFVLGQFSQKLTDMCLLIEEIVFRRLDQRLAAKLVQLPDTACLTHQYLANELGSVRELITRQLGVFSERGWIETGRERISILNRPALSAYAYVV